MATQLINYKLELKKRGLLPTRACRARLVKPRLLPELEYTRPNALTRKGKGCLAFLQVFQQGVCQVFAPSLARAQATLPEKANKQSASPIVLPVPSKAGPTRSGRESAATRQALLSKKTDTKGQLSLTSGFDRRREKLRLLKNKNQTGAYKGKRPRFRKPVRLPKNPSLFCLININRGKNNTHATISNLFGESKTKWAISAGQLKLSGSRRKTRLSQRMIYKSCLEKALSLGYKFSVIHCRGSRGSKVRIFRSFASSLSVLLIKDTTGAAHNGCRPPKVRRV